MHVQSAASHTSEYEDNDHWDYKVRAERIHCLQRYLVKCAQWVARLLALTSACPVCGNLFPSL